MHTSLEVDYWVVDSDGDFAPAGAIAGDSGDGIALGKRAPGSLLTVTTPPRESVDALRRAFVERLEAACARARESERRLVPLATPLNGDPVVDRNGERDERVRVRRAISGIDGDADGTTGLDVGADPGGSTELGAATGPNADRVPYCAGARIRVERRSATDQLNALLALTPALALVNSSPYLAGERVAAGARSHCRRKRLGGTRGDRLCRYVDSAAEWTQRLEERYERVAERAVANGVDAAAVADHLSPADVGWTPVTFREVDGRAMLEWRAPDAALPSQLLELAGDVAAMMDRLQRGTVSVGRRAERGDGVRRRGRRGAESESESETADGGSDATSPPGHATRDGLALPRARTVADLVDAAIYEGLESTPLAAFLERMGFSVGDYHPISARIDGRRYVTRADARELRLEYAGLLEADVDDLGRTLE